MKRYSILFGEFYFKKNGALSWAPVRGWSKEDPLSRRHPQPQRLQVNEEKNEPVFSKKMLESIIHISEWTNQKSDWKIGALKIFGPPSPKKTSLSSPTVPSAWVSKFTSAEKK